MAGAGYKLFNTGDVLTAAQVNTYLQEQAVMRFANATARTTALSGVLAEGMVSYLDDTNALEVYNGSAWVSAGSSGDIEGVTAGTGISGGGTSGTVTITNSMATAIDAKGDLIVGTGADTFARLAVGTNDYVLTAASGETTGLKWSAPSAASGPAFRAYRATSSQSITPSTFTKVQFNTEEFDTDSCFDSTTNYRFTPNKAGYYNLQANVMFDNGSATSRTIIAFYFNGADNLRAVDNKPGIAGPVCNGTVLKYFNGSTDYMEVFAFTDDASAAIFYGQARVVFSGVWIRS